MALDKGTLAGVATLARLQLNEQESDQLAGRLNAILGLIDELQQADVSGLEPLSHPLEISQPLRDDIADNTDYRAAILAQAPASEGGCFLVPQVIE